MILLLLLIAINLNAQESSELQKTIELPKKVVSQTIGIVNEMKSQIEFANVSKEANILIEIEGINEKLGDYSEVKKRECDGEFTVIEVDAGFG